MSGRQKPGFFADFFSGKHLLSWFVVCTVFTSVVILVNTKRERDGRPLPHEFVLPGLNFTLAGPVLSSSDVTVALVQLPVEYRRESFFPRIDCSVETFDVADKHLRLPADICGTFGVFDPDEKLYHAVPACAAIAASDYLGVCRSLVNPDLIFDRCLNVTDCTCPKPCSHTVLRATSATLTNLTGAALINSTSQVTSVALTVPSNNTLLAGNVLVIRVVEPLSHSASSLRIVSISDRWELVPAVVSTPANSADTAGFLHDIHIVFPVTPAFNLTSIEFFAHSAEWQIQSVFVTNCTADSMHNVTSLQLIDSNCTVLNISLADEQLSCSLTTGVSIGHCCVDVPAVTTAPRRVLDVYLQQSVDTARYVTVDVVVDGIVVGTPITPDTPWQRLYLNGSHVDIRLCGNDSFAVRATTSPLLFSTCTRTYPPPRNLTLEPIHFVGFDNELFPDTFPMASAANASDPYLSFSFMQTVSVGIDSAYLPMTCYVNWQVGDLRDDVARAVSGETLPMFFAAGTPDQFSDASALKWSMGIAYAESNASATTLPAAFWFVDPDQTEMKLFSGAAGVPINATHAAAKHAHVTSMTCLPHVLAALPNTQVAYRRWIRNTGFVGNYTPFDVPLTTVPATGRAVVSVAAIDAANVRTTNASSRALVVPASAFPVPTNFTTAPAVTNGHASFFLLPPSLAATELADFYFAFGRMDKIFQKNYINLCYTAGMATAYSHTPFEFVQSDVLTYTLPFFFSGSRFLLEMYGSLYYAGLEEPPRPCYTNTFGPCINHDWCGSSFRYMSDWFHAKYASSFPILTAPVTIAYAWHYGPTPRIVPRITIPPDMTTTFRTPDPSDLVTAPHITYGGPGQSSSQFCLTSLKICQAYSLLASADKACVSCRMPGGLVASSCYSMFSSRSDYFC